MLSPATTLGLFSHVEADGFLYLGAPGGTPLTLHPTPYTLHPSPYTLHPTPYTLHSTLYTLHSTPYTLHPTLYTLCVSCGP